MKKTNEIIQLVADEANVSYEAAKKRMDDIKSRYGISYVKFHAKKLYYKNEMRIAKVAKEEKTDNKWKDKIIEDYSVTDEQIEELRCYYERFLGYKLTLKEILSYDVFSLSDNDRENLIRNLRDMKYYTQKLKSDAREAFYSNDMLDSCVNELNTLRELIQATMTDECREGIIRFVEDYVSDEERARYLAEDVLIDMETMKRVFGNTYIEYIMFEFLEKSLDERAEFLSLAEKREYTEQICDPYEGDKLDSKYQSYCLFKDAYKRDVVYLERSSEAAKEFRKFCSKHDRFIFKPLSGLKGDGIKIVEVPEQYELNDFIDEVMGDCESAVVEELIVQHDALKCFNPDSVNTVRIITYFDGENVHLRWNFIRVGRTGSVVDNAGAGGMFAAIDYETGIITTNGCDETGTKYERHPDSGIAFIGYEIPKWEELRELCTNLATRISTVRYIGWDFTMNQDGEWIVVEANIQPGCRAYQAATMKGIRREFLELLGITITSDNSIDKNVWTVARQLGIPYEEAYIKMSEMRDEYGISFSYYLVHKFHLANKFGLDKRIELFQERQQEYNEYLELVKKKTNKTEEEVYAEIEMLKKNTKYAVSLKHYYIYGFYNGDEKYIYSVIYNLKQKSRMVKKAKSILEKIDKGKASYTQLYTVIDELRLICDETLADETYEKLCERIRRTYPEIDEEPERLRAFAVDMNLMQLVFGFSGMEYMNYRLEGKSLEESNTYISNRERLYKIKLMNSKETSEILDDKYESYQRMGHAYKRDLVKIDTIDDYETFEKFHNNNKTFVKKPIAASQGKGVELLTVSDTIDLKEYLQLLLNENGPMVMESAIVQSGKLSVFNADSVNTARVISFYDKNEVKLMWGFFRTGRAGSFVDNAGSGGVFASLDVNKGELVSCGWDEFGRDFECHPETGIKYMGFKMPNWDEAMSLVKSWAVEFPDMAYIGWDLALNNDDHWMLVEFNAHPEFLQQGPEQRGCRDEFNATFEQYFGMNQNAKSNNSILRRAKKHIKRILKRIIQ